jgi:cytochrome c553
VAYALSLATTAELTQGKTIYEANCASCHGVDGKKSTKSDFSDPARMAKLSLNDLFKTINTGVAPSMPAFESQLSETERYAAAAYLRTFAFATAQGSSASAAETESPAATALATETGAAIPTTSGTPGEIVGTISGKITNKSGGSVPADLKVTLHIFEHDPTTNQFSEANTQETSIKADGTYSFANLQMPTSQAFYVSVDYADTTYSSEPTVPVAGQTAYDLPLDIYDTTTDSSALLADQVHMILDYSKPDVIQIVEFYVISNPGTKTVIPKKGAALVTVSLPKGYTNLQFQDGQLGDRFLQTADGFGDTFPVTPSDQQYQLVFAFDLPYSTDFDFIEPLSLNVSAITFLVSEGVKANAPSIIDGGLKDMGNGGGKYQLYTLGAYKTGQSLKVHVSGAPSPAASAPPVTGTDSTRNMIIGVGAFGLVLILAAGWLFWRDRKRAPVEQLLPEPAQDINADEVIDAIIALDDQRKAGNIADEAYKQRRAELKEKLKGKL